MQVYSIRIRQLRQEELTLRRKRSRQDIGWLNASDVRHRATESEIVPRISGLRRSTADWATSRKRGRCTKESDEAPTNDVPGNRMLIRFIIIV